MTTQHRFIPSPLAEMPFAGRERQTEYVWMTDELIDKFLAFNIPTNRIPSRAWIAELAKDIREKPPIEKKDASKDGPGFDDAGWLVDGQHMLMAFKLAGVEGWVQVTYGMTQDAVLKIDRHKPRKVTDVMRISGLTDWIENKHAPIIHQIYYAQAGKAKRPKAELMAALGDASKDGVMFAADVFDSHVAFVTIAPIKGAIAMAYGQVDDVRLMEFCEVLSTGMPESHGDRAAILLRERLLQDQNVKGQQKQRAAIRLTQRAIKAFVDREDIKQLRAPGEMIYRIQAVEDLL